MPPRKRSEFKVGSRVLVKVGTGEEEHAESARIAAVIQTEEGQTFRLRLERTGEDLGEVAEVSTDLNDLFVQPKRARKSSEPDPEAEPPAPRAR